MKSAGSVMQNPLGVRSVFVIGSGPIVIGQGCEFDYSGTQAVRALKEEGVKVVLLNSNPATIMTDPELADVTYIEPINFESCVAILEREGCDALLPTLGGQTALNVAFELAQRGILAQHNTRLIGVSLDAIRRAEDRRSFKKLVVDAGYDAPRSTVVKSIEGALQALEEIKLPLIIRPSFTLGGSGSGMVRDPDTFAEMVRNGLLKSPAGEVLLEESVEGWKEFELEVMRDSRGNHVVVCSIENLDPMGTHTGDSITVAPVQTLSDRQYQRMRDASFRIMDKVEICGGANVQFALDPKTDKMVVIEMNPRVSRSSALASKATGYPIAKIAAKLALGHTLDQLPNDIVGSIPASFEPALDYCVVKMPRWNFDKFKEANAELSSQMKSIGEVMALGRTFNESLQKALRSVETGWDGLVDEPDLKKDAPAGKDTFFGCDFTQLQSKPDNPVRPLAHRLAVAHPERIFAVKEAFRRGLDVRSVHGLTKIDEWFLENIRLLVLFEEEIKKSGFPCTAEVMEEAKRLGFSDSQLARLWKTMEEEVEALRKTYRIVPTVKTVDTCAGEFEAATPYFYLTYEKECESRATKNRKAVILGSGPNRVGQGIEFDYCCVHAAHALREAGVETIMINCNPETVSTDFDVSDRLYFEPVDYEHVMAVVEKEKPDGVVVQFGGQTPLKLLHRLNNAGVRILGTQVEAVDKAEDRRRCSELLSKLGIKRPQCAFAADREEALEKAKALGFPVLLRPPYVLGGMAMSLVFDEEEMLDVVNEALRQSEGRLLMIDKFIEGAVEVDVDAVSDGENVVIAGSMEHIEEAGIHSGDSSCTFPPVSLEDNVIEQLEEATEKIARELSIIGLLNAQFAVKDDTFYCLEINPRASRTVPYISKATGIQWVKVATRALLGEKIPGALRVGKSREFVAVKTPVLPFDRFPEVDSLLGPEMYSTGEVMGLGSTFGEAFIKAQIASGFRIPEKGKVFISVANRHKRQAVFPAKALDDMGFSLIATSGTAKVLRSHGIPVEVISKMGADSAGIIEMIEKGCIGLIVNTPFGKKSIEDGKAMRLSANKMKIPSVTTMAGFNTLVLGIASRKKTKTGVTSLQDYIARLQ